MRNKNASILLEVLAALLLVIPLASVLYSGFVVILCVQKNDSICREAARAASYADPRQCNERASTVVQMASANTDSSIMKVHLISVDSSLSESELASLSLYGGVPNGSVTVQTEAQIKLPTAIGPKLVLMRSKQTMPYVYAVPISLAPKS